MFLKEVRVGDLIRPANSVEPWYAEVIDIDIVTDPETGEVTYFVTVDWEGNEYSITGPGDWEMEERDG